MSKPARKIEFVVLGALIIVILAIGGAFAWSKLHAATPLPLPVIGQISDFSLTNQNGEEITLANLQGKVWIADIIFTRCAGPCPEMTRHLAEIQSQLPPGQPVRLVTLTSDPAFDTPPVLKKYAAHFGADASHWWFLTGAKSSIQKLAVEDFKFVALEKKPGERETPEDLFIHSAWFVLVDQRGRVRGWKDADDRLHAYFDSADPADRAGILAAAKQLLREPSS